MHAITAKSSEIILLLQLGRLRSNLAGPSPPQHLAGMWGEACIDVLAARPARNSPHVVISLLLATHCWILNCKRNAPGRQKRQQPAGVPIMQLGRECQRGCRLQCRSPLGAQRVVRTTRVVRVSASAERPFPAKVCVVLGSQWGDEGKGKLVDILAQQYDVVARAQVRAPCTPRRGRCHGRAARPCAPPHTWMCACTCICGSMRVHVLVCLHLFGSIACACGAISSSSSSSWWHLHGAPAAAGSSRRHSTVWHQLARHFVTSSHHTSA